MSKYIDAEAFKRRILSYGTPIPFYKRYLADAYVAILRWVCVEVDNTPTADVQEVRHGRWKNEIDTGTEMMACSVCGARVIKQPYISAVGRKGYAYCPYCGASMEGIDE